MRNPGRRNAKRSLALALIVAAPIVVSACGNGGDEDLAKGQELFTQRCGACHILANAQTKGLQGPNLDLAFAESLNSGLGRSTVEGVVRQQIELPQGAEMPANIVTGADADAVAAYVADAIGKPPEGGAAAAGPSGTAKANARNQVDIPADPTGQLAYKFKDAEAKAGKVTLRSRNDSSVPHNIALKDGLTAEGKVVKDGGTSQVSVNAKAGSYTFFCSVPGHEQAGMKGTLKVN